jgi:hypothetical protein
MLSFRASTETAGSKVSVMELAKAHDMRPPISLSELIATKQIADFHGTHLGILTVGSPSGPVKRIAEGGFQQQFSFGSIIKPADAFPDVGNRFHVTVTLAGVRCFGTDDPSGSDEPYLITSVFTIDPREKDKSAHTTRIGPDSIGEVEVGRAFGQNSDLAVDFAVPGDSDIALNVQLFDQELISNP